MNKDESAYVVKGHARNPPNAPAIMDLRIIADFFTSDGVKLGSAEGKFATGVNYIRADDSAAFTITFPTSIGRPDHFYVRVIGRQM
jgi:hypothetical protein